MMTPMKYQYLKLEQIKSVSRRLLLSTALFVAAYFVPAGEWTTGMLVGGTVVGLTCALAFAALVKLKLDYGAYDTGDGF